MPQYSIADNINYGNEKGAWAITRREIEDASCSAYAHEFIMELPKVSHVFHVRRLPLSHMMQFTRFRFSFPHLAVPRRYTAMPFIF